MQYNTKDSSLRLAYGVQPQPRAIASLAGETIVKVACGTNHRDLHQYPEGRYSRGPACYCVACGMGYSMVIVDRTNVGDRFEQLDIYDGKASGERMS
ncbi:hypothetical protein GH714_006468 [Hevea brasiliensis]|uniref:Uncharacterized protein n=1 Tax=Hevea brasiliensis TaxID=3981 RepID=A0A6A6MDN7_HEVBR|nr:hypothetical protein GH714_006468 [Hevea brasiliensis]